MAEQLLDSLVSPTTTTAETVTAGVTTDFDVASAAALPASGTFRLLLKGAADDGSDDALATVGTISGVNCASVTWLENGQVNFDSGTEVELVLTAAGVDAAIDDRTALYLPLTGGELSDDLVIATAGGTAGVYLGVGGNDPDGAIEYDGYSVNFIATDVLVGGISADAFFTYVPLALIDVNAQFRGNLVEQDLAGSTYNLDSSNPPGILLVDQNTTTINLDNIQSHGTAYSHVDILIVVQVDSASFVSAQVHPYTANASGLNSTQHSRINTKGTASSAGIWNLATDGPDGTYYPLAANTVYRLVSSRKKDSSGAVTGHKGTWNLFPVATI